MFAGDILRCPFCQGKFLINEDHVECAHCYRRYVIKMGVPRFVDDEGYSDSFGYEWTRFNLLQLDSYNRTHFSEKRFVACTGWQSNDLDGKFVLDAGCGSGRFTEVALAYGARVVAIDLSDAASVCHRNLHCESLLVCQSSIYDLPFADETFDYVFSIGVLQHTPDPFHAITCLARKVKRGGMLSLWIYERDWKSYVGTVGFKYLLHPLTRSWPRKRQLAFCDMLMRLFFPVARWSRTRGLIGRIVMRLLPISSAHLHGLRLSEEDFKAWVYLDTFDMYSPKYDLPQRFENVAALLASLGFENIRRNPHGGLAISAVKTMSSNALQKIDENHNGTIKEI